MTTNEISSNINVSNKIEYKISVIYFDKELMPIRKIYRSFFIEKIPNMLSKRLKNQKKFKLDEKWFKQKKN